MEKTRHLQMKLCKRTLKKVRMNSYVPHFQSLQTLGRTSWLQHCLDCLYLGWGTSVHAHGWKGEEGCTPHCALSQQSTTNFWPKPQRAAEQSDVSTGFYLTNYNCIMVETLHKKFYGTDRQYPIIPQEQRQETNAYVLELPGTKKKKKNIKPGSKKHSCMYCKYVWTKANRVPCHCHSQRA